jgi:DNA-binding MarR family transcriptional regulator
MSRNLIRPRAAPPASGDDLLGLAAELRLAVTRLARVLRQRADVGVTPSMLSALTTIDRLGPVTLGKLAAAEQVQPPTMTSIVSRLEEGGMVVRETDPVDRRVARVRVSVDGKRLLERTRSRKTAYLAKALRAVDPEDREILERAVPLLAKLSEEDA